MNAQTQHLHGLRAAQNMVELVRQLADAWQIKLETCEIKLDDGKKYTLEAREYLELAKTAIGKAIEDLKARHERPQPGLN
jgi:hypothetical protein